VDDDEEWLSAETRALIQVRDQIDRLREHVHYSIDKLREEEKERHLERSKQEAATLATLQEIKRSLWGLILMIAVIAYATKWL